MIAKINRTPALPTPIGLSSIGEISQYLLNLINTLSSVLRDTSATVNAIIDQITPNGPVPLKTYVKASLPSAVTYVNNLIIVSDDVGGLTPAFSDGTNWRRTADRAVIA